MLNNCSAIELLPWQAQDHELEAHALLLRPFHPASSPPHPSRPPARSPTHPAHPAHPLPTRKPSLSRSHQLSAMLQNDSLLSESGNQGSPAQKGGLKRRVELLSEGDICFKSLSRQHLRKPQLSESQLRNDLARRHSNNHPLPGNKPAAGLAKFSNPLIRAHQDAQPLRKVSFSDFVEQRKLKERSDKFKEERSLKVLASRYRHLEEKLTLDTSDSASLMLPENSRVGEEKRSQGRSRMDRKKWKANLKMVLQEKESSICNKSRQNLKIVGLLRVHG